MIVHDLEQFIEAVLFRVYGGSVTLNSHKKTSGGCINNGVIISCKEKKNNFKLFLKWNDQVEKDFFIKEYQGLDVLKKHAKLTIPETIHSGEIQGRNYLLLAYIHSNSKSDSFWSDLGNGIAELHSNHSILYGAEKDNFIGLLPQKNTQKINWIDFFIENRLEVQLGLAIYNGHISLDFAKKFKYLYAQLPGILAEEPPSLLHGDLWSGNFMPDEDGNPCLIDPAVYYGNREIEIAFTRLFGGFDRKFYDSYHESFPLQPGFEERIEIYNLYPLLVHVNLFGPSYLSGIEKTVRRFYV